MSQTMGRWEARLRRFTKSLAGNEEASGMLQEVARVLTNVFHSQGFLDIVPSDILAGFVLVRAEQANRRCEAFERYQMELQDKKSFRIITEEDGGKQEEEAEEAIFTTELKQNESEEHHNHEHGKYVCILPYAQLRRIANSLDDISKSSDRELLQEVATLCLLPYSHPHLLDDDSALIISSWLRYCTLGRGIRYVCCYWFGSREHDEGFDFWAYDRTALPTWHELFPDTMLVYTDIVNDTLHKPTSLFVNMHDKKIIFSIRGTLSI